MLPLPNIKASRINLIDELFHRIKADIGFENLNKQDNGHLDNYHGRVLLKLELEALKKAITVDDLGLKRQHLTNALIFRKNRLTNQELKDAENSLEMNEGLAEYTTLMLSGRNDKEINQRLRTFLILGVTYFLV